MRILTGIQPSGQIHLGNYFGAIQNVLGMQDKGHEVFLFLADFHALTTVRDPEALRQGSISAALDFLACGVDPERTIFWRQSAVPEVQELAWLLSVITPMGLLERCHSYKDKLAHGKEATHGLFAYPVLMAADILLYQADLVPVGKDQKQHLEVTRDLALKFNNAYGEHFKIPDAYIPDNVATVPGTDGQKMSKSYGNVIPLFDSPKRIKTSIMGIVTDSTPLEEPKDPETCNVYNIYKLLATPEQVEEMASKLRAGGYGYGDAKKALLAAYHEKFDACAARREELSKNLDYVEDILRKGAERARAVATPTLEAVRKAVGL